MDFAMIMEAVANNGLAIVLVVLFVIYGRKFVNKIIDNYTVQLKSKDKVINNHLAHVDDSLNRVCAQCAVNKETLNQGFNRVVDAIDRQTRSLKNEEEDN
jgi:hypothetical protein